MAAVVDEAAVEHGNMMIKNGQALFNDIMSGKPKMKMYKGGTTPESDDMMKYTIRLAENQLQVMALLDKMTDVKNWSTP